MTPLELDPRLGLATLHRALADLAAGVHEDIGPNDGVRIREYLANFGLTPPEPWCAAGFGTWLKEASHELGVAMPIAGSASALATGDQFNALGLFVPIAKATPAVLVPGNVAVWQRGELRCPPGVKSSGFKICPLGCKGHIGVIESFDGKNALTTIDANSGPVGDRVARMTRAIDDPKLLGIGILSPRGASLVVKTPGVSVSMPSYQALLWLCVGGAIGWKLMQVAKT